MVKNSGDGGSQEPVTENAGRPEHLLHPAWLSLVRYCAELRHGEIERLKIQDGLPVLAEITRQKIKFSP